MNTTTKLFSALLSTVLLPLLGACDPAEATQEEDPGDVQFRCAFCCTSCGLGNSPYVNGFPVSTLRVGQNPVTNEWQIVGVRGPGSETLHALDVVDDEFVVRHGYNGPIVAAGADMVGWTIVLHTTVPELIQGPDVEITINGYDDSIPAWSSLGGVHTGYALTYTPGGELPGLPWSPGLPAENVCGGGTGEMNATLIYGEVYDEETATVIPNRAPFFTIACAGQAVAKMKMFNFGPNDSVAGQGPATWRERQATLKMLVADYCGDGTSYTEPGTEISWDNKFGTIDGLVELPSHEARWNEHGAMCLDTPRVVDREDVPCAAFLPTCDYVSANAWSGWMWDTSLFGGS